MKKTIMIIIFTAIITGIISIYGAYAATNYAINASKIGYSDNSNLGVDNVQAAIDGTCTKFNEQLTELRESMYPVGSIYLSTSLTTASAVATKLGGTWEVYGQGRTLVGVGSNGTTSYVANTTGGNEKNSYTVKSSGTISTYSGNSGSTTLTTDQIPAHNHSVSAFNAPYPYALTTGGNTNGIVLAQAVATGASLPIPAHNTNSTGGSQGHTHTINHTHTFTGDSSTISPSTIQPYITVYMYKRTA